MTNRKNILSLEQSNAIVHQGQILANKLIETALKDAQKEGTPSFAIEVLDAAAIFILVNNAYNSIAIGGHDKDVVLQNIFYLINAELENYLAAPTSDFIKSSLN